MQTQALQIEELLKQKKMGRIDDSIRLYTSLENSYVFKK